MSARKRSHPKGPGARPGRAPRALPARPVPGKPQYYRLIVEIPAGERITIEGRMSKAVTLVERGPLGLCEQRGMEAANYGVFHLSKDGTREWHRPTRIMIEPVDEESEEARHEMEFENERALPADLDKYSRAGGFPIEEHGERSKGDGSHSEADS